jgi:hypothetical protein
VAEFSQQVDVVEVFAAGEAVGQLLRGLTAASISLQRGQRKTKRPSRSFDGGPSRPRAAMVTP